MALSTLIRRCAAGSVALGLVYATLHQFALASDQQTVSVQVKESKLRAKPEFWASSVSDLTYGQRLVVAGSEAGWIKAQTSNGKVGYVHPSAVTEKKIVLAGTNVASSANNSDIVLAGKGFNSSIEKDYAAENPSLNYAAVNQMERLHVSDAELGAFLSEGQLGGGSK